jgi:isopentenyl diphosphate isomerase/L-lactate dehydrogenase-like FMN-dependent dehydrogenase
MATKPMEEVIAAQPNTFVQLYWAGDRQHLARRLERIREAGAKGLIITLDWSFNYQHDWDVPIMPNGLGLAAMARFSHYVFPRPRWLARYAKSGALPSLQVPNSALREDPPPSFWDAYVTWQTTPPPTWSDLEWLRETWGGPFLVKGIMRVDDARRARDIGATAISVSNHGGNNLDSTPASIRALPRIADAVGSDLEVLMDGGIRRGSDVVKALALGARAVLIGRPYVWGLAANGQQGVEDVLQILRAGIDATLLGLGKSSISELTRSDVLMKDDFPVSAGEEPALALSR